MSYGAQLARELKSDLPEHAESLETMAKDFDDLEVILTECDEIEERLNLRAR